MTQMALESDAEGYVLFLADVLGWTKEEVQVYIAYYRREVRSNKYCPYYRQKFFGGESRSNNAYFLYSRPFFVNEAHFPSSLWLDTAVIVGNVYDTKTVWAR